jgi:hypothetical protein
MTERESMSVEHDPHFAALADDIVDWGERFLRVLDECGPEAAQQVLGGIAEWLGTDLVDAMPVMDMEQWLLLDGLAEELFQSCRACIGGNGEACRQVTAVISRTREIRDRVL